MKHLEISFSGKALVIKDTKTKESCAAVVRKKKIEFHKLFTDNKKLLVVNKLFVAMSHYIASFDKKRKLKGLTMIQRLKRLFVVIKSFRNADSFTKIYNRLSDIVTPIYVTL